MEIRRAKLEDYKIVASLFDQYRQFYKKPSDVTAAERFLKDRLSHDESVIFLASENDTPVGFVQLYPSFSSLSMQRSWILNDLFVCPPFRRKKVAKLLISAATEFGRETQSRSLTLKTATDNQAAQKLYEGLDWRRDEKFISYDLILG